MSILRSTICIETVTHYKICIQFCFNNRDMWKWRNSLRLKVKQIPEPFSLHLSFQVFTLHLLSSKSIIYVKCVTKTSFKLIVTLNKGYIFLTIAFIIFMMLFSFWFESKITDTGTNYSTIKHHMYHYCDFLVCSKVQQRIWLTTSGEWSGSWSLIRS